MKVVYFAIIFHLLLLGSFSNPVFGFYPPDPAKEIRSLIERVIESSPHEKWVELLRRIELQNLPHSATVFFPTDVDVSVMLKRLARDPSLIHLHVLPHALTLCELRQFFRPGMRIPTLRPGSPLLVTGNAGSNFTINGVPVTRPQMFYNGAVAVHGIPSLLDSTAAAAAPDASPPPSQSSGAMPLSAGIAIALFAVSSVFLA